MKISQPFANKMGASAEIIFTSSSDFITFFRVSHVLQLDYLDSSKRELVDFEIMVLVLDLIDDMLPVRRQDIAVLSLQALRDVLEGRVELGRGRDIATLRDLTRGAEMAAAGLRIVREGRRTRHLLLWATLRRSRILVRVHLSKHGQCERERLLSLCRDVLFLGFARRLLDQNNGTA